MATATCTKCGKECFWRAFRGSRLADQRSSCCQAPLQGKTAGRASSNKGKKLIPCGVCGKKTVCPKYPAIPYSCFGETISYSAKTPVCWRHSLVPAGKTWAEFCEMSCEEKDKFERDLSSQVQDSV